LILDIIIQIAVGIIGGLLTAILIRFFTHAFDFIPRNLHNIGIGSSFESFFARGFVDNYNDVLWIRLHNHSSVPIYFIRAVYFPKKSNMPIYQNAIKSQKYSNGYEIKFGEQWKDMSYLLMPKAETQTYMPLKNEYDSFDFPQGRRGKLIIEYVHDGKTGIHRTNL
jgi:hypothetical protein